MTKGQLQYTTPASNHTKAEANGAEVVGVGSGLVVFDDGGANRENCWALAACGEIAARAVRGVGVVWDEVGAAWTRQG